MAISLANKPIKELVTGVKKPSASWQVENYKPTKIPISKTHVETALGLIKLKAEADNTDGDGDQALFVYGKDGSDSYKITL